MNPIFHWGRKNHHIFYLFYLFYSFLFKVTLRLIIWFLGIFSFPSLIQFLLDFPWVVKLSINTRNKICENCFKSSCVYLTSSRFIYLACHRILSHHFFAGKKILPLQPKKRCVIVSWFLKKPQNDPIDSFCHWIRFFSIAISQIN